MYNTMNSSTPIVSNPMSKQSVILDNVQTLSTRVNSFSRMTAMVLACMGLMTLANFGTSIAALLYIKDMYVDDTNNMLVNADNQPVGTSSAMDVNDAFNFPSHEDVLQKIASGMAVYNGSQITRVEQGIIGDDGDVALYDSNGNHLGVASVESYEVIPTRHLEATGIQRMAFVNSVTGSRLCKDPAKACYDAWKRKCIPCSGEFRNIKQETNNVDQVCTHSGSCPAGWACNTVEKKCVKMDNHEAHN